MINSKRLKNLLKKSAHILGIFLFIYILSRLNFPYYLHHLPKVNWWLILSLLPIMVIMLLIKTWRWQIMLKRQNINYPFSRAWLLYLSGIYFGAITPGRIGELGRLYYLKKDNHSTVGSLTTLILDKILDLILAVILGIAGLLFYGQYLQIKERYILILVALLIIFLIFNRWSKILFPSLNKKIAELKQQLKSGLKNYRPIDHFLIYTTTIFSWLIYLFTAYIATRGVGINNINIWYAAMVMNLATLVSLLPISIMGMGTRESLFIFFYYLKNQPQELALAVSMIILLINIFAIFLGFIAWLMLRRENPKSSSPLPSATAASDAASHNLPGNKL